MPCREGSVPRGRGFLAAMVISLDFAWTDPEVNNNKILHFIMESPRMCVSM